MSDRSTDEKFLIYVGHYADNETYTKIGKTTKINDLGWSGCSQEAKMSPKTAQEAPKSDHDRPR